MTELYNIYIYEKYKEIKNSGKIIDNNDLCKYLNGSRVLS